MEGTTDMAQTISSTEGEPGNLSVKVGRFYRTAPLLTRILPSSYNAPPSGLPRRSEAELQDAQKAFQQGRNE
jgi:hypothetical protein